MFPLTAPSSAHSIRRPLSVAEFTLNFDSQGDVETDDEGGGTESFQDDPISPTILKKLRAITKAGIKLSVWTSMSDINVLAFWEKKHGSNSTVNK